MKRRRKQSRRIGSRQKAVFNLMLTLDTETLTTTVRTMDYFCFTLFNSNKKLVIFFSEQRKKREVCENQIKMNIK